MPPKQRPNRVPLPGAKKRRPDTRLMVMLLAAAAAVTVGAIVLSVTLGGSHKKIPPSTIAGSGSLLSGIPQNGLVLGSPEAKVTLTEYIDATCPACREYTLATLPSIVKQYVRPGKVKIEMRPVNNGWPSGARGRELILAAARQDKGWQFAELGYHNQGDEQVAWLTDDLARAFAAKVPGLNVDTLFADAKSAAVQSEVKALEAEAQTDGVKSTPTFVLTTPDGTRHPLWAGAYPFSAFATTLNDALKA
jgi:protein-disulfide isomerase